MKLFLCLLVVFSLYSCRNSDETIQIHRTADSSTIHYKKWKSGKLLVNFHKTIATKNLPPQIQDSLLQRIQDSLMDLR